MANLDLLHHCIMFPEAIDGSGWMTVGRLTVLGRLLQRDGRAVEIWQVLQA